MLFWIISVLLQKMLLNSIQNLTTIVFGQTKSKVTKAIRNAATRNSTVIGWVTCGNTAMQSEAFEVMVEWELAWSVLQRAIGVS